MKYVIYAGVNECGEYCEKLGGSIVLYELGNRLKKKGQDVYMLCSKTIKNIPKIQLQDIEKIRDDSWIIYPEIIWGNPLNFKNVIRWILYDPDTWGNTKTWGETDLIYKFCEYFTIENDSKTEKNYLRINDFKLDIFYNKNLNIRTQDCHLFRKFKGTFQIYYSNTSKCLDGNLYTLKELSEIFNTTNTFICYDNATYYSIMAALCGAVSVIIPDTKINISKDEFIKKFPIFKYGVAYGMNDIDWAKSTMHLVKDYLLTLDNESDILLDMFIENTQKKFIK